MIRKATIHDAQSLSDLVLSLGKYCGDGRCSEISPYFSENLSVKALEKCLADEKAYEHYVYEKDQKIVGYFSLMNGNYFLYLFVDESYHRQGIASALIAYALRERDHTLYRLNASLYAVPFYEKLGFVPMAFLQKQHGLTYQPMIWDSSKNRVKNKK